MNVPKWVRELDGGEELGYAYLLACVAIIAPPWIAYQWLRGRR